MYPKHSKKPRIPSSPNQSVQILPQTSCQHLILLRKRPLCSAKSQPGTSGLQLFSRLFEQRSWEVGFFQLIAPAVEQRGLETPADRPHAAAMCLLAEDQTNVSPGHPSHLQLLTFRPTFLCSLCSDFSLKRDEGCTVKRCSVSQTQQTSSLSGESPWMCFTAACSSSRCHGIMQNTGFLRQDSHQWVLSEMWDKKGTF